MKICTVCGREIPRGIMSILYQEEENAEWALLCPECDARLYTCATCKMGYEPCRFELIGPSTGLPPIVQQVMRNGNMQMITQIKNPEIVAKACPECPCYVAQRCVRESGQGCENFRLYQRSTS